MWVRVFPLTVGCVALALAGLGCRGRSGAGSAEPLVPATLAKRPGITVLQPAGARGVLPLRIAIFGDLHGCEAARQGGPVFVICLVPGTADESAGMTLSEGAKGALRELKAARGEYLKKGPVTVVGGPAQTEAVMRLAAEEPSFFAGLVIQSSDEVKVSNVRLHAFGSRGGKKLALVGLPEGESLRVQSAALAAGLAVASFSGNPEGMRAAAAFATVDGPLEPALPPPT